MLVESQNKLRNDQNPAENLKRLNKIIENQELSKQGAKCQNRFETLHPNGNDGRQKINLTPTVVQWTKHLKIHGNEFDRSLVKRKLSKNSFG